MSYTIEDLTVRPREFTESLTVDVVFKVPNGSTVTNPDGTTSAHFNMSATGGQITLNFRATEGSGSAGTYFVSRTGHLSPVSQTGLAHRTTAVLYKTTAEKDRKSKTQDEYEVDPEFIDDPIK